MPRYTVYVRESSVFRYRVEADDEEAAREKALDAYKTDDSGPWDGPQFEEASVEIDAEED